MGPTLSRSQIRDKEMQDYLDLTFLTRSEILNAYSRFRDICGVPVEECSPDLSSCSGDVMEIPELKENPFKKRIVSVFSSQDTGKVTFEDFLDMLSVFCEASPTSIKIEYAFRIYDFDNDGMLNRADIEQVIRQITPNSDSLLEEDITLIINNVLVEADLDGDDKLSYAEFEHAMTKSIDFASTYLIRLYTL